MKIALYSALALAVSSVSLTADRYYGLYGYNVHPLAQTDSEMEEPCDRDPVLNSHDEEEEYAQVDSE